MLPYCKKLEINIKGLSDKQLKESIQTAKIEKNRKEILSDAEKYGIDISAMTDDEAKIAITAAKDKRKKSLFEEAYFIC